MQQDHTTDRGGPGWRVAAALIAQNPDDGLGASLDAIAPQVERVVVLDNGSDAQGRERIAGLVAGHANAALVRVEEDVGLAGGLNRAIRDLHFLGFAWCVTLEQHSLPAPDMVARMLDHVRHSAEAGVIAVVAPNFADATRPDGRRRWLSLKRVRPLGFRQGECDGESITEVVALTTGCLTHIGTWWGLGGFDESLFVDYVDTDYCLRVTAAGYRVDVACAALLRCTDPVPHRSCRPGAPGRDTPNPPLQRYYLCRNRIRVLRKHGNRWPNWLLYELSATLRSTLRALIREPGRLAHLRACILGTWDGLRGRIGRTHRRFGEPPDRGRETVA